MVCSKNFHFTNLQTIHYRTYTSLNQRCFSISAENWKVWDLFSWQAEIHWKNPKSNWSRRGWCNVMTLVCPINAVFFGSAVPSVFFRCFFFKALTLFPFSKRFSKIFVNQLVLKTLGELYHHLFWTYLVISSIITDICWFVYI